MEMKTLGVTTACYVGFALEDALQGISKAGFPCVEIVAARGIPGAEHIRPNFITNEEIESLTKKLADANLQLISIAGYSDLTKPESAAYTKKCLDVAEKLGVDIITTGCGRDASQEAVKQFYKNMEELGEYALNKGITIGSEDLALLKYFAPGWEVQNLQDLLIRLNHLGKNAAARFIAVFSDQIKEFDKFIQWVWNF